MDRVKLKTKAKELIKDNKWYIWKPTVMFSLVVFAIGFVISFIAFLISEKTGTIVGSIFGSCISIIESVFMVAYAKYILAFVRGKKMDWKEIIEDGKKHFGLYFLVSLLVGLIILGGTILLVVPGIIASIGLMFYQEVCVDNPKLGVVEIVKKSWKLTNGHKMDLFILGLSFIGWSLLATLTLGILYIWLMPYMMVTFVLAYEKLKK